LFTNSKLFFTSINSLLNQETSKHEIVEGNIKQPV